MKSKFITIFLLLIGISALHSQQLEIYGGPNYNRFHDYDRGNGYFQSTYYSKYGYSFGLGIDSFKIDWMKIRLAAQFDNYSGNLTASSGGHSGEVHTNADVKKSVISIGIFPICIKIVRRIDLNIGFEFSRLVDEDISGTESGWRMDWSTGTPHIIEENYTLKEEYKRYNALNYFGLKSRIAYNFRLSKRIILSPQYLFYFGMFREFAEFPEFTKSMRQYLNLGLKFKLNH